MFYKSVQRLILVSSKIQEEAGEWEHYIKDLAIL